MPEVRFDTTPAVTPATDPSKPAEGATVVNDKTVQLQPPTIKAPEAPATERPSWLPEKFKSAEDLAKAYAELEKSRGEAPPKSTPKPEGAKTEWSLDSLSKEYADTGAISEATLAAAEAKGIPRAMVSTYIKGLEALAERQTAVLSEGIGGPEVLKGTLEWAAKNASASEIAGYNGMVDAGNLEAAKVLLGHLHARYTAAVGNDPALVNGAGGSGAASVGGFASSQEMVTAMSDPRYQTDPAYRKLVEQRVAKSTAF